VELLGYDETQRYLQAVAQNKRYWIREDQLQQLRKGLCCTVIRKQRAEGIVRNIYKTNSYMMTPDTAFAYCSLQDYRASNGETGAAMIFAEESPLAALQTMETLLGISSGDIKKMMDA
jgi:threonine synthase